MRERARAWVCMCTSMHLSLGRGISSGGRGGREADEVSRVPTFCGQDSGGAPPAGRGERARQGCTGRSAAFRRCVHPRLLLKPGVGVLPEEPAVWVRPSTCRPEAAIEARDQRVSWPPIGSRLRRPGRARGRSAPWCRCASAHGGRRAAGAGKTAVLCRPGWRRGGSRWTPRGAQTGPWKDRDTSAHRYSARWLSGRSL